MIRNNDDERVRRIMRINFKMRRNIICDSPLAFNAHVSTSFIHKIFFELMNFSFLLIFVT